MDDGLIHSAGRGAGTGMTAKELKAFGTGADASPGADDATGEPPPRDSRFGLRLKLSGVHWVRPEVVVDVTYFTWTEDNLPVAGLASQGQRKDKPGTQVVRTIPKLPRRKEDRR
jgi:bifunctional non-homologous end joining protein LigD